MVLTEMISLYGPIDLGQLKLFIATANQNLDTDHMRKKLVSSGYGIVDMVLLGDIVKFYEEITGEKMAREPSSFEALEGGKTILKGARFLIYFRTQ